MVEGKSPTWFFFFLHVHTVFSLLTDKKIIFFPLNSLGTLVKNHWPHLQGFFSWDSFSIPFVCMSFCMPIPHHFNYCIFVVSFEVKMQVLKFCSCFSRLFGIWGSFNSPCRFWGEFFYFCKEIIGISDSDCIESVDSVGLYWHLSNSSISWTQHVFSFI